MKFRNNKAAAAAMALLVTAGTVFPSTAVFAVNRYTPVQGTQASFDKYLVMDKEAQVPNVSFTFTITPGNAKTYSVEGKKFEVLAGVGTPTMAGVGTNQKNTIAFAPGDGSDSDAAHSEGDLVKNLDTSVSKYAKKTAVVDFSGCSFTEPGVYRYVITESGSNQAVTNDADLTRIMDVYVIDDNGVLKVQSYVLHANESDLIMGTGHGTEDIEESEMKPQGFTNEYDTSNLTFRKQVAGNQASHDKYFEFTLQITDAQPGTVYDVLLTGADAVSEKNDATIPENAGKTNPSTLTVGEDGTVLQKFYLQHGQQITVQGIAKDTSYTVTENPEDYKPRANTAASPVVEICQGSVSADTVGVIQDKDLTTGYLNERRGVIPTGVMMTVAPFAAVTLFGGLGAATIMMKRKKED
ncbi:MAG: QVPTGV class sortase B protein-sorting domain-containing protein [Lachnospiraceae bacterium]|nr:QVPTGV class sortase B protein-sorting domain-containing protein [Lachnospiraceae bacterium]